MRELPTSDSLLIGAYYVLAGCECRSGAFYRNANRGLAHQIREHLAARGIAVPPHKPAVPLSPSPTYPSRPALTLVPAGLSCGDDDWTDDVTRGNQMEEK